MMLAKWPKSSDWWCRLGKLVPAGDEVVAYQGKMLEIVNQNMTSGDKTITFEWARRAPGTRLIIVDLQKQTIRLTKEHRYELDADDYRLPGGKVFDTLEEYNAFLENGKDVIEPATEKARGEALEESGVKIDSLAHFHTSICGTTVQWDLLYFVSTEWSIAEQSLETGETSVPVDIPLAEAAKMAIDGRISEERSALILLKWLGQHGIIKL